MIVARIHSWFESRGKGPGGWLIKANAPLTHQALSAQPLTQYAVRVSMGQRNRRRFLPTPSLALCSADLALGRCRSGDLSHKSPRTFSLAEGGTCRALSAGVRWFPECRGAYESLALGRVRVGSAELLTPTGYGVTHHLCLSITVPGVRRVQDRGGEQIHHRRLCQHRQHITALKKRSCRPSGRRKELCDQERQRGFPTKTILVLHNSICTPSANHGWALCTTRLRDWTLCHW
jgi:hypothetical protein